MNPVLLRIIKQWLPLAVGITAIVFIIYLVIQQDLRIGANDPQIQMAEDTASALSSGQTISLNGKIDISKSLAPFTIIYDKAGQVVSSSAVLNGKTPVVPHGALSAQKGTDLGENRITWQPEDGVRLALVIVRYVKGYVLVGRNIREIEIRENDQFNNIFLGWMLSLIATFSCVTVMQLLFGKKKIT